MQENSQNSRENSTNSIKIIFMGTPSFAARILDELINESVNLSLQKGVESAKRLEKLENATNPKKFDILCVFTNEDKAFGRKKELKESEVKALARAKIPQTPIFTPKTLKNDEIIKQIQGFKPDFIVVAAYGKILPKSVLEIAPCVNLHASLLPKYRGASPIQQAILNGDEISGVCAMLMSERLDGGAVLASEKLNIKDKRASEVFEQMSELAAALCVRVLREFNVLKATPQDESKASYCVKIKKEDGLVNLKDAREIYRKFLAFYPWPGVFLENGLKFMDMEFVDSAAHERAGEILSIEKEGFLLACKVGTLRIKALQESGKKILNAKVYLNGKRLGSGDSLC